MQAETKVTTKVCHHIALFIGGEQKNTRIGPAMQKEG